MTNTIWHFPTPQSEEFRGIQHLPGAYGCVVLISTETLLELKLTTARSGNPSRLKSPTATDTGVLAARKLRAARKLPSPLPKSTETLLESWLATTTSSHPSPLKSPTAIDTGVLPAPKFCGAWKV